MPRTRWITRIAAAIAMGLAGAVISVVPAIASDETLGVDVPSQATTVWIDVEQAGLTADAVVVATLTDGTPVPVSMTTTTFGLHGEVPATAGRLSLSVTSAPGAAPSTPDLALTVLDADSRVLASAEARLSLAGSGRPAVVEPIRQDATVAPPSPSGMLALTGPGQVAIGVALALLTMGALILIGRRVLRARGEVAR